MVWTTFSFLTPASNWKIFLRAKDETRMKKKSPLGFFVSRLYRSRHLFLLLLLFLFNRLRNWYLLNQTIAACFYLFILVYYLLNNLVFLSIDRSRARFPLCSKESQRKEKNDSFSFNHFNYQGEKKWTSTRISQLMRPNECRGTWR